MTEKKTIFAEEVKCPHCKKYLIIKKIKTTVEEPVKGEYQEKIVVEKSTQTRLKKAGE